MNELCGDSWARACINDLPLHNGCNFVDYFLLCEVYIYFLAMSSFVAAMSFLWLL